MEKKFVNLNVRITEPMRIQLDELATEEDLSISHIVRSLIRMRIAGQRKHCKETQNTEHHKRRSA